MQAASFVVGQYHMVEIRKELKEIRTILEDHEEAAFRLVLKETSSLFEDLKANAIIDSEYRLDFDARMRQVMDEVLSFKSSVLNRSSPRE